MRRRGTCRSASFACVTLVFALFSGCLTAELTNVEVVRKIDIRSNVELSVSTIRMRNDAEKALKSFSFSLNPKEHHRVGDIFAASGTKVKVDSSNLLSITSGQLPQTYSVKFRQPLAPGEETTVTLSVDFLTTLKAVPSKIKAKEDQYMRYYGDAYFYSPYPTKTVMTTIAIPSARVISANNLRNPNTMKSYQVVLGPYENIESFDTAPFNIRFKNNRGFLVANRCLLHYHVSHWGRIAVREEFELRNDAATLDGEWSRADYDRGTGMVDPTSHEDTWANLPADAENIRYKDLIGNITTSRLREPSYKYRAFQLIFRFPLLGGWRNHFWFTYDILLKHYIRSEGQRHELTLPVLPSLHYDLPIEHHVVRIVLPEGATSIEVEPHRTIQFDSKTELEWTSLSFGGRPTVVLTRENVRSQAPHVRNIVVRYSFSQERLLIMPAYVATVLIGILAIIWIFSRGNFVLVHDESEDKRLALVDKEVKKIEDVYSEVSSSYTKLQELFNDVRTKKAENVDSNRTAITNTLVKHEEALKRIAIRLRELNSDVLGGQVEKLVATLVKKRDYSLRFVSIENAFKNEEMTRNNYIDEMARIATPAMKLSKEIVSLYQKICMEK